MLYARSIVAEGRYSADNLPRDAVKREEILAENLHRQVRFDGTGLFESAYSISSNSASKD
jgi:hypothetical protein